MTVEDGGRAAATHGRDVRRRRGQDAQLIAPEWYEFAGHGVRQRHGLIAYGIPWDARFRREAQGTGTASTFGPRRGASGNLAAGNYVLKFYPREDGPPWTRSTSPRSTPGTPFSVVLAPGESSICADTSWPAGAASKSNDDDVHAAAGPRPGGGGRGGRARAARPVALPRGAPLSRPGAGCSSSAPAAAGPRPRPWAGRCLRWLGRFLATGPYSSPGSRASHLVLVSKLSRCSRAASARTVLGVTVGNTPSADRPVSRLPASFTGHLRPLGSHGLGSGCGCTATPVFTPDRR